MRLFSKSIIVPICSNSMVPSPPLPGPPRMMCTESKQAESSSEESGRYKLRSIAGASQTVRRTTATALCYIAAEYCAPAWARSPYTRLVDTKLRETKRITSGCLKSTPTQWFPVASTIGRPHLRREEATQRWVSNLKNSNQEIPSRKSLKMFLPLPE